LESFKDPAVIILSGAAMISLAAGIAATFLDDVHETAWIDGVAILMAVLIVAVVSATNNYSKDLQFRALKEKNSDEKNELYVMEGNNLLTCWSEIFVSFTPEIKFRVTEYIYPGF